MDDIMHRPRYSRHNISARRRKRNNREGPSLGETVIKQIFFSVLLLLLIVVIKNINTPVTNYLSENIQKAISNDVELKSLYEDVRDIFQKVKKNEIVDTDETGFSEEAIPVSGDISMVEDSTSQQLNENYCLGEELILPLNGYLGAGFGERVHPIKNTVVFHKGIDIEAENGESIKAVLSGVVLEAGSKPSYGKYVRIWHRTGLETVYAHCSNLVVKKGQEVKQGDVIAQVGDTGAAAVGAHLHFEVWKDGKPVDPLNYIQVPSR